jgi:hypothetical protein
MNLPNVVTERKIDDCIVRVLAFRKVTESEFNQALNVWFNQNRKKTLPKNKIVTIQTTFGQF